MNEEEITWKLKDLLLNISKILSEKLEKNEIKPIEEAYFKWVVDKFRYTDNGVESHSAKGDYIIKKNWWREIINLEKTFQGLDEYKSVLVGLEKEGLEKQQASSYLAQLVRKAAFHYLDKVPLTEDSINNFISRFLADLNKRPLRAWVEIEVHGLILEDDSIDVGHDILIRKVCKEDIEKEISIHPVFTPRRHQMINPSSIIKIEKMIEKNPQKLQREVEKIISILRLFKVGSIMWSSYTMDSKSIVNFIEGTITSGKNIVVPLKYIIKKEEKDIFERFTSIFKEHIPKNFYWQNSETQNYTTISYHRYCDALLEAGIIERRIANVVMGLEALFLNENQELKYRLKLRVSKFLSLVGHNPYLVKKMIHSAYDIRSLFAHGETLNYDKKKKFESKVGELSNFLLSILNCLRESLVLCTLISFDKEKLIDMIDDSFLDRKKEEALKNSISQWKNILLTETKE